MSVRIGDTFRASYADGNPLWKIISKSGASAYICESQPEVFTLSDGREIESDYAGITKAFAKSEVEAAKRWERTLNRLGDQHRDFYDSLKVGQIVHYNDGFQNFVRCEVVIGTPENVGGLEPEELIGQKCLQPIALVGNWKSYDLAVRRPNGNVEHGYHARKILDGNGAWRANDGCIFESPSYSYGTRTNAIDPTNLPALSLELPEMTEAEAQDAAAERVAEKMIEALSDHTVPAVERIAAAINQTRGAL